MNKKIIYVLYLMTLFCSSSYTEAASSEEISTSVPVIAALRKLSQQQSTRGKRKQIHQSTEKEPFFGESGNYKCTICSYSCEKISHIKVHCSTHIDAREYACTESGCQRTFNRKDTLTRHIQEQHAKLNFFPCSKCGKTFARKERLDSHYQTYVGQKHPSLNSAKKRKKRLPASAEQLPIEQSVDNDSTEDLTADPTISESTKLKAASLSSPEASPGKKAAIAALVEELKATAPSELFHQNSFAWQRQSEELDW